MKVFPSDFQRGVSRYVIHVVVYYPVFSLFGGVVLEHILWIFFFCWTGTILCAFCNNVSIRIRNKFDSNFDGLSFSLSLSGVIVTDIIFKCQCYVCPQHQAFGVYIKYWTQTVPLFPCSNCQQKWENQTSYTSTKTITLLFHILKRNRLNK